VSLKYWRGKGFYRASLAAVNQPYNRVIRNLKYHSERIVTKLKPNAKESITAIRKFLGTAKNPSLSRLNRPLNQGFPENKFLQHLNAQYYVLMVFSLQFYLAPRLSSKFSIFKRNKLCAKRYHTQDI
jgi:hypothetical protein